MIEMSVEKETVLLREQPVDASVLQQNTETSEDSFKNPSNVVNQETDAQNEKIIVHCGDVAAADSFIQSQNGIQPHKPHQQRLNKRRSTMSSGFKSPVSGKRRRRANSESECVLPTNFLMGGNIFDPLNLNSLLDEEVNRALNAETPKSSPLPSKGRDPVEILIPRDITDPLNLNNCTGETSIVLTPFKSGGGRRRHRNRHHGTAGSARAVVTACVEAVVENKVGEELSQLNQAEPQTPQTESKSVSCNLPSSSKEDCSESTAFLKDESDGPLMSKQENLKAKDQTDALNMHTFATQTSHRQRKRKRSNSRSENPTASSSEKNPPTSSSSAFGSAQQLPIHKGQQKCNYQKGSQQNNQKNLNQQTPKQQKKKFQYGNYNQYYGYRNPGACEDVRLRVFRPEWFRGKEVLDLGCNTGHLTLTIAKNWRPVRMVGMDIDKALIHAAKQNIRHYLSEMHMLQSREVRKEGRDLDEDKAGDEEPEDKITKPQKNECEIKTENEKEVNWGSEGKQKTSETQIHKPENSEGDGSEHQQLVEESNAEKEIDSKGFRESESCLFPVSLRISRGPIAAPPLPDTQTLPPGNFPANVTFIAGNYVLDNDALLKSQREEYDVVLCLSVTKWVHLNWGDVGLKRLFHRVYRHLRPGGLFILEPQPWSSYSKRKKLTDTIYNNYFSIQFKPEQFSSFLTSEVGFSSYELLGTPNSSARGFQRPIYVFYKDPSHRK